MTTTTPSAVLVPVQPVFTDAERLALAGFLAGYRGLTRDAYALDLRQFTTWCRMRSVPLFAVRRADIESLARDLEAEGRARATSPARCAPSPGSTGTRSRKNCSSISRPRMSAVRAWITSGTRSAWTATSSVRSWLPRASARLVSTR